MKKKIKNRIPKSPKGWNSIWLVLALLCASFFYLFWYKTVSRNVKPVSYSVFLRLVEEDKVDSIAVRGDYVEGVLKQNGAFFQGMEMDIPILVV